VPGFRAHLLIFFSARFRHLLIFLRARFRTPPAFCAPGAGLKKVRWTLPVRDGDWVGVEVGWLPPMALGFEGWLRFGHSSVRHLLLAQLRWLDFLLSRSCLNSWVWSLPCASSTACAAQMARFPSQSLLLELLGLVTPLCVIYCSRSSDGSISFSVALA